MVKLRNVPSKYKKKYDKKEDFWSDYYDIWEKHLLDLEKKLKAEFVWIRIPDKPRILEKQAVIDILTPYIDKLRQ
jgi:hypothetical protein